MRVIQVPITDPGPTVQAAFHVFGMELLAELDLDTTNQFFSAFFRLPAPYWQGFLASRLSSARLIVFAAATFMVRGSCPSLGDTSVVLLVALVGCLRGQNLGRPSTVLYLALLVAV